MCVVFTVIHLTWVLPASAGMGPLQLNALLPCLLLLVLRIKATSLLLCLLLGCASLTSWLFFLSKGLSLLLPVQDFSYVGSSKLVPWLSSHLGGTVVCHVVQDPVESSAPRIPVLPSLCHHIPIQGENPGKTLVACCVD